MLHIQVVQDVLPVLSLQLPPPLQGRPQVLRCQLLLLLHHLQLDLANQSYQGGQLDQKHPVHINFI